MRFMLPLLRRLQGFQAPTKLDSGTGDVQRVEVGCRAVECAGWGFGISNRGYLGTALAVYALFAATFPGASC